MLVGGGIVWVNYYYLPNATNQIVEMPLPPSTNPISTASSTPTLSANHISTVSSTSAPSLNTQTPSIKNNAPKINSEPAKTYSGPAADVFLIQDDGTLVQSGNIIDIEAVSRKFYSLYPDKDNYDFLSIFTTFLDSSKPHLHYIVKKDVGGIGTEQVATLSNFGSNKLLGVNFFNTTLTMDELNSTEKAVKTNFSIIDHELSHQWLMYAGNDFAFGADDNYHYGRWVNSAFMRGGEEWVDTNGGFIWKDNQNGTLSIPDSNFSAKRGFSKLSLYLMGFLPSSDVPDLEVVVPKDPTDRISRTIKGTFKKVSVNDIIAKNGERNPSYQNSQKNFRMAYILLSKKNKTPAQYQLNAINYIAQNYPSEWNYLTHGKSTINQ